jgi:hypothetical protein
VIISKIKGGGFIFCPVGKRISPGNKENKSVPFFAHFLLKEVVHDK